MSGWWRYFTGEFYAGDPAVVFMADTSSMTFLSWDTRKDASRIFCMVNRMEKMLFFHESGGYFIERTVCF